MFLYFLLTPTLIFLIIQIDRIYLITKHDRVLYMFCQLRREMIYFLRNENPILNEQDKISILKLLELTNHCIHHFKDHKKRTFKFKIFKIVFFTKSTIENMKENDFFTENIRIQAMQKKFILVMLYAAYSYTSFLSLRLIGFILKLLLKIHLKRLNDSVANLIWLVNEYNNVPKYKLELDTKYPNLSF